MLETRTGILINGYDDSYLVLDGTEHVYKSHHDINIGDAICVKRKYEFCENDAVIDFEFGVKSKYATNIKEVTIPETCNHLLGEWLGYIIANGVSVQNYVAMSSIPSLSTSNYHSLVKNLFGLNLRVSREREGTDCVSHVLHSVIVVKFLDYLTGGFTTARFKKFPEFVKTSSKETQRRFIRALFDCDGCQLKGGFEFSSASEYLIRSVQEVLFRFGIVSTIKRAYAKQYPDHTYWKLFIRGDNVDKLYYEILFDSYKYLIKEDKKRNTNIDLVYGALERMTRSINLARKTLGVNKAGTYLDKDGKQTRFIAAKFLNTMNCYNMSYFALENVYNDFKSSPEDQRDVLNEDIVWMENVLKKNYFYDIVVGESEDTVCEYFPDEFLIKK